ncbi:YraN family protein [Patescibacteria group bacterium]|nr:YraN family protein [Patescibacteria group bacterium]
MSSKRLGDFGEKIAKKYLEDKGYQILDKNYSFGFISGPQRGEIDIIAQKNYIISFVEVKTLAKSSGGRSSVIPPEEKVNFKKKRKIIRTAESWLMEKKIPLDSKWQIDIISIRVDLNKKLAKIKHFENAVF